MLLTLLRNAFSFAPLRADSVGGAKQFLSQLDCVAQSRRVPGALWRWNNTARYISQHKSIAAGRKPGAAIGGFLCLAA
jgi:hypothetical protein